MPDLDITSPQLRQDLLDRRLQAGVALSAGDLATELGVSLDTIRRDFIALEQSGRGRRVRGGLAPVSRPEGPMAQRMHRPDPAIAGIAQTAAGLLATAHTLLIDGGTTALAVARSLPPLPGRLVITPAPAVALACQVAGAEVELLGGTLSARGGIVTGGVPLEALQNLAAEVAVLGACGCDAGFGLSADDAAEAQVKSAMARAADRTMVVTAAAKIGRRARHRVMPAGAIADLVTDATDTRALAAEGVLVHMPPI